MGNIPDLFIVICSEETVICKVAHHDDGACDAFSETALIADFVEEGDIADEDELFT